VYFNILNLVTLQEQSDPSATTIIKISFVNVCLASYNEHQSQDIHVYEISSSKASM